ncbi:aminotransferase class V-fold PLP-dependent enzyme [Parasulfitobacter algicola]|uniref:Aminotransferase class V-fold PLP-dependent enzyme n=1 Tax=Parasulfitobacter algicola TaxID=2614809 RepID=A0ABX2IXY8_9RHOB|nr:aminotransferase class V-fold PLP-dependent enzyme [Sulfitobacter algicola]NSX55419.1 aminotransferase class V-fold PLP-dependent enzyme [Sulfitobacter algicola]
MTKLDTDFVRGQFLAFSEPSLRDQVFAENAGGSYACRHVIWRLTRFYKQRKVQPYAPYAASLLAGDEMDEARERLARLLNVGSDELVFGPSTTQNVYVLANAFAEWMVPGQTIIVTDQDHEANSGAWRKLANFGIEIREWKIDPETGHLDIEDLKNLLDDTVKLVCFPHCSNVIGEINPVEEITQLAHAVGAVVCVDGVSYAPHGFPNVSKLGADIYMFSSYKTYGPHQGIMVIRRALAAALPNQAHSFNGDALHKRFSPAGPDHAQVAACAGIADYVDALYSQHFKAGRDGAGRAGCVHDLVRAYEIDLMKPLLDYLSSKNNIRLLGPKDAKLRAPTFAIEISGKAEDAAARLAHHGIMAGGGDFYAVRPLKAMGIDPAKGVLRLSFVHYNVASELDRVINALDQVL